MTVLTEVLERADQSGQDPINRPSLGFAFVEAAICDLTFLHQIMWLYREHIELLLLVLGRMLQIQEGKEVSPEVEVETQHLVARATMTASTNREVVKVVRNIISYLPACNDRFMRRS
ncbi:MAG TPA: hypothetical protein VGD98_09430 [Ktedonobacteraceae bacterium]